jgi:4'-phosphopantetheinyl transferase
VPAVPAGAPSAHHRLVAVWRVRLEAAGREPQLRRSLADDELGRLDRLRRPEVAERWLVSRAALREILAAELGITAPEIRLKRDRHGRPALDPESHQADLDFNLSHSADLALVATARGVRVGVDLERLRPGRDPMRTARRYFSAAELAALRALPPRDRPAAFLRYWTAKEALAKGLGLGLRIPKGELELAQQPGRTMVPVRQARDWHLVELSDLPDGYCGSLATDDGDARIVVRDWPHGAGTG